MIKGKLPLFAWLFILITGGNYLFVDRDIFSALFQGFFTALLMTFVFNPLVKKPMDLLMKKLSERYRKSE
jgi:hypothetical protein